MKNTVRIKVTYENDPDSDNRQPSIEEWLAFKHWVRNTDQDLVRFVFDDITFFYVNTEVESAISLLQLKYSKLTFSILKKTNPYLMIRFPI